MYYTYICLESVFYLTALPVAKIVQRWLYVKEIWVRGIGRKIRLGFRRSFREKQKTSVSGTVAQIPLGLNLVGGAENNHGRNHDSRCFG
jgi:hypothetical protein